MRICTWFRLAVPCLIAACVMASVAPLLARPFPPTPPKLRYQHDFEGYGLTPKDADANALERACNWLYADAGLGWTPTPEFLREKNMVQFGERTEKKSEIAKEFGGVVQVVKMRLEVSDEQAEQMRELARHERMKERQKTSLFVVIGLVCLLGVIGGYLRLEEATKGYYTRLLRIAAISVLLVVVAGLCVLG
jgi:hypothetical protein